MYSPYVCNSIRFEWLNFSTFLCSRRTHKSAIAGTFSEICLFTFFLSLSICLYKTDIVRSFFAVLFSLISSIWPIHYFVCSFSQSLTKLQIHFLFFFCFIQSMMTFVFRLFYCLFTGSLAYSLPLTSGVLCADYLEYESNISISNLLLLLLTCFQHRIQIVSN